MDFITKPFGWLIMFLYELTNNYGLAVILFALVVKIILMPFQAKSKRSMMRTGRLQPKLKELEKKHGANKQKYNEEVAKLYKEEKINPMSGCLWSLIPFPIIIALFSAIRSPLTIMMGVAQSALNPGGAIYNLLPSNLTAASAYSQINQAEYISKHFSDFQGIPNLRAIHYDFLGMNLGKTPDWQFLWKTNWNDVSVWLPGLLLFLLPILSGILAYFSSKISMQINPMANQQQQSSTKSMLLMMPLISVYFAYIMPGAIGVYIIASTLFAMIQDIILTKRYTNLMDIEDAAKNERLKVKQEELESKRLETERKKIEHSTTVNPNTSKKKLVKSERQEQLEKASEWEKTNSPAEDKKEENPSRIENRRYARGRAYNPLRFETNEDITQEDAQADDTAAASENESAE